MLSLIKSETPFTRRKGFVMPFTPFHIGPALLLGLAFSQFFDLPALLIASVIPDLEPLYVMHFNISGYPLHGFFHSYLGASILALFVAAIFYPLRGLFGKVMTFFRIPRKTSLKKILLTSFVGVYSHVFLDSFLYGEMMPFYPLQGNPFINILVHYQYSIIYGFCSLSFLLGIIAYLIRLRLAFQK
jgi:membrane-bound metal-dependent hydrolase YbcI (DUF457 family)